MLLLHHEKSSQASSVRHKHIHQASKSLTNKPKKASCQFMIISGRQGSKA